jgi:hypothetical protein
MLNVKLFGALNLAVSVTRVASMVRVCVDVGYTPETPQIDGSGNTEQSVVLGGQEVPPD